MNRLHDRDQRFLDVVEFSSDVNVVELSSDVSGLIGMPTPISTSWRFSSDVNGLIDRRQRFTSQRVEEAAHRVALLPARSTTSSHQRSRHLGAVGVPREHFSFTAIAASSPAVSRHQGYAIKEYKTEDYQNQFETEDYYQNQLETEDYYKNQQKAEDYYKNQDVH